MNRDRTAPDAPTDGEEEPLSGRSPQIYDGTSEFYAGGVKKGWVHAFDDANGVRWHYWAVKPDPLPTSTTLVHDARYLARDAYAVFVAAAKTEFGNDVACSRFSRA